MADDTPIEQPAQPEQAQVPPRIHHTVVVDLSKVQAGENEYTCTDCKEAITLVWDGATFSLTEADANDPAFGTVGITLVGELPQASEVAPV